MCLCLLVALTEKINRSYIPIESHIMKGSKTPYNKQKSPCYHPFITMEGIRPYPIEYGFAGFYIFIFPIEMRNHHQREQGGGHNPYRGEYSQILHNLRMYKEET